MVSVCTQAEENVRKFGDLLYRKQVHAPAKLQAELWETLLDQEKISNCEAALYVAIWHRALSHFSSGGHVHDLCSSYAKLWASEAAWSWCSRIQTTTTGTRAAVCCKTGLARWYQHIARLQSWIWHMCCLWSSSHSTVHSSFLWLHGTHISVEKTCWRTPIDSSSNKHTT